MKKKNLIKQLKQKGAEFVRHGGSHELWKSRNGYLFSIPRHNEIGERLAKTILRQADN